MTYTLFETLEDLLYHLRNGYVAVETQLDLSGRNIVHITILGKPISQITYKKATLEDENNCMFAVSNSDLQVVEQIGYGLNFLKTISGSRNVKDINLTPTSINFTYKDRYAIKSLHRSINGLEIRSLETSEIKFATLPYYLDVFEILDKNIKNF